MLAAMVQRTCIFSGFAEFRGESERVPLESRGMLRAPRMRKTRRGAQAKEKDTVGFEQEGLCLRSGHVALTLVPT
jgi:hypothetical protein